MSVGERIQRSYWLAALDDMIEEVTGGSVLDLPASVYGQVLNMYDQKLSPEQAFNKLMKVVSVAA
jgi:hypothetical protein